MPAVLECIQLVSVRRVKMAMMIIRDARFPTTPKCMNDLFQCLLAVVGYNIGSPNVIPLYILKSSKGDVTHAYRLLVIELLADSRIDPSRNNNVALRTAAEHCQAEIVRLLLHDRRVDPSVNLNAAIYEACTSQC